MPKGVPKSQGEKLKDKFDESYGQMKKEFRKGRKHKDKCGCDSCEKKKKK